MFCELCNLVFDGDTCPTCQNTEVRPPRPEDICFLVEKERMWGDLLADVLTRQHIPFLRKGTLGEGMALRSGPMLERFRFYVSYHSLPDAAVIVEALFGDRVSGL
ncbi:MAG: hypothetical protein IJ259_05145 [Oscillospiraceae bacterium]|nr:hypothetical protein [Oscillospiraceae bacterium]